MTNLRALLPVTLPIVLGFACAGTRVIPDRPLRADAAAREFTANVRVTRPDAKFEQKLYVGNGRTRSDSVGREPPTMILNDFDRRATLLVVPSLRTGLLMPEMSKDEESPDDYLAAPDGSPCSTTSAVCQRVGEAQVGPFQTVEWRVERGTGAERLAQRIWVDQVTRVKVKTVTTGAKTETVEFLDLQMGHQPDALFVVPEGTRVARMVAEPR